MKVAVRIAGLGTGLGRNGAGRIGDVVRRTAQQRGNSRPPVPKPVENSKER